MPNSDITDFSKKEAWFAEVERSRRMAENYWPTWEENLKYYTGTSPDNQRDPEWVNVNADFTNCEVKLSQLFFAQPDLQISAQGQFKSRPPAAPIPGAPPVQQLDPSSIVGAHRSLLNELLSNTSADVLGTVHQCIKDCLVTAGVGVSKIAYEATVESIPQPAIPGEMLGLNEPAQRVIDEKWVWERVPSKKFRVPADFNSTDFDKAPWLGMEFRMPLNQARRLFKLPENFTGTTDRDERVLEGEKPSQESTNIPYVDGVEIWYRAAWFDEDVVNPEVIRRHVLIDGVQEFAEQTSESPYQTLLPTGRLSADSLRGYPLHVLVLRTVPDSAYVPSDSTMARPLIRELCKFRTQQVQERDANIPRILYDSEKLPPDVIQKIQDGDLGSLIPVPPDVLMAGADKIMAQVTQGNQTRGSYVANDYIQRDLDKTLGIDAIGSGVQDSKTSTATEINVVDKQRSVRLDAERRRVLDWYIKGVYKFSALVARFMTPEMAMPYIGQEQTMAWQMWDKQAWDGRFVFEARPDSQIKLDAASERKFALDLYQFARKDPLANGQALLKNVFEKAGLNPSETTQPPPPPRPTEPSVALSFKGEDLMSPAADQVREILAQVGVKISQQAIDSTGNQLFQQIQLGLRDASGKAVAATPMQAQHGGPQEQVRPMAQASADSSGQRAGMGKK